MGGWGWLRTWVSASCVWKVALFFSLVQYFVFSARAACSGCLVGGRIGRLVGGWVGGWVGVVSYVGECFVCEGGGPVLFLWYSTLFSPLERPARAEFETQTKASVCCCTCSCTAVAYGGWVGWWVDGFVGGWVCHVVRGRCFVGELEAGVLVRLLCCVLLPCSLLLNAAVLRVFLLFRESSCAEFCTLNLQPVY